MKMNIMNSSIMNSPWPIMMSMNMMSMSMNLVMNINSNFLLSMIILTTMILLNFIMWMENSMKEKMFTGMMSNYNEITMKMMIYIIIMTETMFFMTFFYINFSMYYFNNWMFNFKYNMNMFKLNFILSFTNLMILLSSSMTLMISTYMNETSKNMSLMYLKMTMYMGMYFVFIQSMEYSMLSYNMSNSIFFSNFYMLTMFHMTHVIMGTMMLKLMTKMKTKYLNKNKTKKKMLCWYWHFVDMIWVMIFVTMYTK